MKKTFAILSAVLLGMPLVCSGEDDLTVLTNQPDKQLELLLILIRILYRSIALVQMEMLLILVI